MTGAHMLDERLATFWSQAAGRAADELRTDLDDLLDGLAVEPARAVFERASLHDFLGEEDAAVSLYRAALDAGIGQPQRTQALVQVASSLRNVGDASAAVAILRSIPADDPLHADAQAFLALALHDDDKPTPALRTALHALAPQLRDYGRAIDRYAEDLLARERIRVIVVGLLVHDGRILAETYPAGSHHGPFLRAPGGGIAFGETADAAVRREFAEELGVVLDDIRPLAVTESIYAVGPKRGHEIVHVYHVRSGELERLPPDGRLPVADSTTTVGWHRLSDLSTGDVPFYPPGVLDLARGLL